MKTNPLRIVFDCAVAFGGTSLNKEVLQGPDSTNNLVGVLLRFREEQVAVMGDIEGMFHQVRVSPKHRDALVGVGGRLKNPSLSEKAQHPIILPKNHHVSRLVARRPHEFQSGHSGKEYVLSLIRQTFWIVGARPLVKRVLKECVLRKRLKGKPEVQQMADLPAERVTPDNPPFSYVGVDCFGPFVVKRVRSQLKRYGCLFTCLTMRAIHIEKLDSLEADSFINVFVRFCARRGVPRKVRSDNGTNFVGGEKELREAMRSWKDDGKAKAHFL